ncbi:PAS domain S-box-containing protein/diguanylate cyclase (GGDEF)-like protein [Pseudoduganella flava]|uniref:EAL domain-containing protein n=1 Tax=Pseudoduganella flava TaxID=871742 RepID=A0A562PEK2_9BURK|nr:GGDEF domain-containing phosphodiesterase [Pseudoduganella flava]QGZ38823.1 EAL domain-containing protein [Pseudoduganella flava]TWI42885.1 PAS domain S-box-containing protein/diguanylate cyclase (GGDEF)-like protein [Pseudoduganella flava]
MREAALARCLELSRLARDQQGDAQTQTLALLETELAAELTVLRAQKEQVDEAAMELDLAGYVTGWNRGAERMFGYAADEAIGQHVLFLYADDDEEGNIAELVVESDNAVAEVRRRKKSGDVIWVRLSISLVKDATSEPAGMHVRLTQLRDELSPAEKMSLHARIIEDSDQGVLITDASERIVSINSAFTRITGYTMAEAIGKTPDLLRSGVHDADFRGQVRAAMQGGGPWRGEIVGRRKSGELFPQSVVVSAVRDEHGRISHTFSLFTDISVHKDAEARMQRMANYDALTGLPNQGLLMQLLGQAMAEARRNRDHGALLVIEITRLGAIADTLGHDVGNALLVEAGRLLRSRLREGDILARLDGGKFAVGLLRIERREHAALVARKLVDVLAAPIVVGTHTLQVGTHVGIAVYPEDAHEPGALLRGADVAAARAGTSMEPALLFFSEEMNQRAKEHLRIESELRDALANGELQLYYQPKVSLRSGRIVGAEALLRWRHPVRGLVSPGVFIPVAEETGLIMELGNWVVEEACRQIRAWQDANLVMPPIAVNLSARQFDRGLPQRMAEALQRHAVHPEQIMLEITESLLVRGAETVIAIMNELVAMGLALALDDFGTGYSSLAYLKKFPISTLKIDRAFVVGLPHEENDCAIARAIVMMAQQLRQEIVAEGVETMEQMTFLRELGCDQLQGYLFSQPVPAHDFERMLREGRRLALPAAN